MLPLQKVRHHNKLQQMLCSEHTSLSLCCWAWACEWNMAATLQACLPRVLFVMTFWLAEVAWMGDNPGGLNSWLIVPQTVCWRCLYLHAAACNVMLFGVTALFRLFWHGILFVMPFWLDEVAQLVGDPGSPEPLIVLQKVCWRCL